MNMKKLVSAALAAAMCVSLATASASAADFPGKKSITIVCPYAAGGASDTTSRIFASELEKAIGTTVMVQNTTGASGAIGLETVRTGRLYNRLYACRVYNAFFSGVYRFNYR